MATAAEGKVHRFETSDSAGTVAVGRELVALLTPPQFLILRGDLGAGKTTLVKGIVEALNAAEADEVTSPTFTLIHEYEGERTSGNKKHPVTLYHLDLYRLESERQLDALGVEELVADDSIVLVEWGEKFDSIVKRSNGEIRIEAAAGDMRQITVTFK